MPYGFRLASQHTPRGGRHGGRRMTKLRAHARFGGKASENAIGGRVTGGREGGLSILSERRCRVRWGIRLLRSPNFLFSPHRNDGPFLGPGTLFSGSGYFKDKDKLLCRHVARISFLWSISAPSTPRPPPSLPPPYLFPRRNFSTTRRSTPRLPRRLGTKAVDGKSYEHEMFCNGSVRAR